MQLCSNCGIDPVTNYPGTTLCNNCQRYKNSNGVHRPAYLHGRHKLDYSMLARWCKVCGNTEIDSYQRCKTCANYYRAHGKDRPYHLRNGEKNCKVCGVPIVAGNNVKGCCRTCTRYKHRNGKDRPRHLWRIGQHGWCDCGNPAITIIADMPLCKSCAELELSE